MGKSSLNWRWTSGLGRLGAAADHAGILLDPHYMIRLEVPGEPHLRQKLLHNPTLSCQRENPERCWAPWLGPPHTGVSCVSMPRRVGAEKQDLGSLI